jgi:serine protease AprX
MGFSSRGPTQDLLSKPNLVAPGVTIVSDRATGSTIEQMHQDAWVGDCCIKGTGTSQATAVVTGVAALMLQADPGMTPNVAKKTLVATAKGYITGQPGAGAGAGVVDALGATTAALLGQYDGNPANGAWRSSDGSGLLEASRGSMHVYADTNGDGVPELVQNEIDVFGRPWTGWDGSTWDTTWESESYAGTGWDANSWDSNSWDGSQWDGSQWASNSWN